MKLNSVLRQIEWVFSVLGWKPEKEKVRRHWEELHKSGYHPDVDGIVSRIQRHSNGELTTWIDFLKSIGVNVPPLKGKVFGEIGHGGGWYLAQALEAGASKAIGFEIDDGLNRRAGEALDRLGFQSFELNLVDEFFSNLEKLAFVDVLLCLTVIQHLEPDYLRDYLRTIRENLSDGATFICQVLEHDKPTAVRTSPSDTFSVRYSEADVRRMFQDSGFEVGQYVRHDFESASHWGIYTLAKKGSA